MLAHERAELLDGDLPGVVVVHRLPRRVDVVLAQGVGVDPEVLANGADELVL